MRQTSSLSRDIVPGASEEGASDRWLRTNAVDALRGVEAGGAGADAQVTGGSRSRLSLDSHNHAVWTQEVLYTALPESGFSKPALAIGSRVVKAVVRFDEHVEAHE